MKADQYGIVSSDKREYWSEPAAFTADEPFGALNPANTHTGRRLRVPDLDCGTPRDLNFFPLDEPQTPVKTDLEKLLEMATNVAVNNAYAARDREALERLVKVFAETIAPVANRRGRMVSE